jgi:hypothetical protein
VIHRAAGNANTLGSIDFPSLAMTRKKLPIGIQTFAKIREGNHYYVDKTPFALRLIDQGTHFFLSRPRRFGKSLFLDTLKELFEANAALFEGLYAESRWDRVFPGGSCVAADQGPWLCRQIPRVEPAHPPDRR